MKSLAMLASLLLGAAAAHAAPPGVNLSWDECGAAGALNRDFACDTNEGFQAIVGSLVTPPEVETADVLGFESFLRFEFGSAVPDWWQFRNAGSCRQTAVTLSFDYGGMGACANPWQGQPFGALGGYGLVGTYALLNIPTILDASVQGPLVAGVEYYMFRLLIANDRTTGPGACLGCQDTARIVHYRTSILFATTTRDVTTASTRNYVLWQQSVVPVRPTSWSSIKQLYR